MSDREKQPTEIELAAKKFEFLAAGAPLSNVLFGYPDQKRLWWLAARALRAEAEREQVMEWGKMESSGGVLAICPECKYPVSWWHKTPFCGNCGRKLDGGGQEARKGE